MPVQRFAQAVGAVYVLVGLLGFAFLAVGVLRPGGPGPGGSGGTPRPLLGPVI
jgi:hypothetical protein